MGVHQMNDSAQQGIPNQGNQQANGNNILLTQTQQKLPERTFVRYEYAKGFWDFGMVKCYDRSGVKATVMCLLSSAPSWIPRKPNINTPLVPISEFHCPKCQQLFTVYNGSTGPSDGFDVITEHWKRHFILSEK